MVDDNLIGHGIFDYLVVFGLILYGIYAGITKPSRILYIFPACLSFFFFIEVGPRLTADKLVPFLFILSVIFSKGIGYFKINNSVARHWSFKITLLISISFLIGLIYQNFYSTVLSTPFLKTRLYIQVIGYFNIVLILLIAKIECSKPGGKRKLLVSFVVTTTILCLYGGYQYFAHLNGWAYRGIVYSDAKTGLGSFSDAENIIFRVNSFANEPKRLTYFLVIGILILFNYRDRFIKKIGILLFYGILALHLVILWLTYSTSIYISLAIFLGIISIYATLVSANKRLTTRLIGVSIVLGVGFYYQEAYVSSLYEIRVKKQFDTEEIRAEVRGQEFIANQPLKFIVGIGPGNYNFALAYYYPYGAGISVEGFLIPFNSAMMTYVYDFGIIGFYLLMIPLFRIIANRKRSNSPFAVYIVFLYCTSITLNPSASLFYFIGAFEGQDLLGNES